MAILRNDTTVRSADGQTTSAIVTAANIGSYGISTTSTYYIGTTQNVFNRASASQTLTGVSIDGNAATVTNGVYTTGAQTIGGTKTFSDGIVVNSATYNTFSKPSTTNYQTVTLFGSASGGLFLTTDNAIIGTGAYYNNGWIATATSGRNLDFASGNFTFTAFSGATVGGAASFGTIAQLTSAGVFSTTGDFRAPIFYDSNDTTYYLDPANTGTALLVAGTIAYKPSVGNNVVIGNDATYGTSGTGRFVGIGFGGLSNSANKIFAHNMGEDGLYICSATSRGIYFRANGGSTDHVAITSGGSMGIGTSSPSQKLHVVGNIIVAPASSSWAEGLSFTMPTASTWGGLRWRREVANNDGNHYIGYTGLDSTDDLVFGSNNGGTQINNNIRITKAGLVGIGTIPTQKFHVSGIAYSDTDFRAPIFYDSNDTAYYCDPNGTSRLANLRVYSSFDTASSDVYANMRVIRDAAYTDGLFIGYNNAGTGTTKIFGGGATTGELTKYSNYTLEPGSFRAPIFYDSDNTNYYIDAANTGTSAYFAGQGRQNDGKYTRDFKSFQWVSGTASYYSSGTSGWYKVAQITITSNCTGAVLYGRLYDIAYHDCEIYDISVVIRAECDFTTNNESHFVELGCTVVASSDQTDYRNKIRAVLTASSTNSRTYELQFFETSWNADAWELFTSGWTVYDSAQAPGTSTGTPRVFYQSKMNADIMYANASSRAPIFYDSDNTNYYVDPASGSNVNNLTTAGTLYTNNIAKNANGSPIVINSGLNASGYALRVYYDMQLYNTLTFTDSAWNSQGSINGSSSVVNITAATATTTFTKYAGYSQEGGSFRAPIFYDSNDTNYYLDPASTSRLNTTRIGNINVGSGTYLNTITPIGDTNINLSAPSGAFYFDTFPRMPGFYDSDDTNFYANPAGESKFNYLRLTNNNALYFTTTAPAELNNESNSTDVGFRMIKSGTSFADGNNYGVVNFRRTNHNNTATNAGASIFFELKDSGGTIREYAGISGCKTEAGAAGGRLIFHRYARTELGYWDTDQLYSSSSMRSPIFYDSNDTTYYIDPAASTSINVNGYIISSGTGGNKGALLGNLQVGYAGTYNTVQTPTNADTIWLQYSHSGNVGLAYGGGYTTAYGSIRSPIFYDSDNTAYYVDPASTSNLNGLTVAGGNATIYRDLTVNGGTGGSYGNRIIVQGTATTYTLQDNAIRPTVYLTGAYPVVTLNHTVTNNANHGPTIQFAFNGLTTGGSTSRQIVIGANGTATYLDFGFSGGGSGTNSDYNPHNGIAGYAGLTPMRLFSNGLLLGSTGTYPNHIISTSYALDVRGTGYSNTDFRAPIFYDSDNTSYYINAASTSNLVGLTVANTITGSVSGNSATATNVAWTGITQATRTNYDLTFQPPNSGYAGFTFNTTGGVAGSAGYFLVRGTSDSDVYTAEGITLVADAGWLTLAQRTTASRGVKIMTGTTSAERLKVTTAGDFQIVNGNSFTYNGNVVLHAGNYTSYTLPIGGSWYGANLPGTRWNGMSVNGGEIVFGRDLPAVGQMGILVDGCYIAGENNGFWSLGSSNDWGTRRGFYWDGSYLNFTTGSAVALFNDARATIFYDSNDTTYYIDPASTSLINSLKIAGGIYNNGSVTDDDTFGIFWESSYSSAYAIFREPGAWQNPYPDLRIAFHTGIKLGANSGYNGIRFYNDYDMATQVMSVNNNGDALGANNVYVNNSLVAGSSLRAPIFYDTNNTAYYIDPASSSRVDVITSNDDYTYGWFRSYTSGYGIYNQVTGQHFYSDDVSYWNVASSSSSQGIRLRTGGYGGTVRGYFYADTNNDVGILNNAGNWRLRVVGGDYGLADGSSMRAQIFYDSNDTAYYVDANSTSNLLLVKTRNTFGQRIAVTASSPITIDTQYSLTQLTLTGSISSMSFSNIQADGIVHMWTIVTVGNATAYTITWPAAVKWPGGTAPTVTTTNTKRDIYQFVTYDGGTNIYAIIVGQNL